MISIEGEVPWIGSAGKTRAGCLHLPAGTQHTKGKTLFPKWKPPAVRKPSTSTQHTRSSSAGLHPTPEGTGQWGPPLHRAYPHAGLGAGPSPALAQSHLLVSALRTSQNNRVGRSLHTVCSRSSSRDAPQLCGPKRSKPPLFKMFL